MKKLVLAFLAITCVSSFCSDVPLDHLQASYRVALRHKRDGSPSGFGTAVAFDKRHLITAHHVIEGEVAIFIDLFNDEGDFIQRSVLAHVESDDANNDLAIIFVDEDLPHSIVLKFAKPNLGDKIYAVGAAWGDAPYTVAEGSFVSRHHEVFDKDSQASCSVAGGMSGGGVYDKDGNLVGITSRGAPHTGVLFVRSEIVEEFIKKSAKAAKDTDE